MPADGKCPSRDCQWQYDIHSELKRNIARRLPPSAINALLCPYCGKEISSKLTICQKCGRVVVGSAAFEKSYFFIAICLVLIFLSLIYKHLIM